MLKTTIPMMLFFFLAMMPIACSSDKPDDGGDDGGGDGGGTGSAVYEELYDQPSDKGQYWLPEPTVLPEGYYICTGDDFNDFGRYEIDRASATLGLQYANMCESLSGLAFRAVQQGKAGSAIWLDGSGNSYRLCKQELSQMGVYEKGKSDGISLLKSSQFSGIVEGYVLTDVVSNPESSVVAAVASHVYNSVIVDVRDEELYKEAGLQMKYDARNKTTVDSWKEFKDKCNNKALVLMPAQSNDLKDFAIANDLFVINIKNTSGNNWQLFNEVLAWLEPCSPVYGWEDLDEHSFVQPVSESGNMIVCNNFSMNMPLTSLRYSERQKDLLVNVYNPKKIDFSNNDTDKFVSYYLSDGDNVQWIFHIWYDGWFKHPDSESIKMSFGIPSANVDMIAPPVFRNIVNTQNPANTLVENCGGGYIYIDDFAKKANRAERLPMLAGKVAASMRQHRVKVLGLFTNDARSDSAKESYKAFVEANDQLEGIIVVQYVPYNGGYGDIYWFKNSKGVDIPVITVKYTIWNFGANEPGGQGTPAFVAGKIKMSSTNFSLVDIHAWSSFTDIGSSEDPLGECTPGGNVSGAGAAVMCQRRLPSNFHAVSLQEFIWRVRMYHHPEKTREIIDSYK